MRLLNLLATLSGQIFSETSNRSQKWLIKSQLKQFHSTISH
nr:MAG TPA: hypothetical protein [Caudoviricetes sp.]